MKLDQLFNLIKKREQTQTQNSNNLTQQNNIMP